MTEKVKISREQEKLLNERISHYKQQGLNLNQIVSCVFDDKKSRGFFEGTSFHNMGTFDFMKILTGQYEVEQTPEDKLQILYKDCKYSHDSDDETFAKGIKTALNILGIKIKGVNA